MKDILYFNSVEDIRLLDALRISNKDKELPNQIILTIQSSGAGEITPIFSKDASGTTVFASIDDIGTKFILDGKEITSDDFQIIEGKEAEFGLQFQDSNEHTLKISLIDSTIQPYTFCYENFLIRVIISNSITSIGGYAFNGCIALTNITIPNSVTSIGNQAFNNCNSLTSITIPNSVTSIGNNVFSGCSGLTSVTIGNSVTTIGSEAFCNCSGLTSVTIPNSVTEIGDRAFYGCSGLTSVTIGNSVTEIGNAAFRDCRGLTSITSLTTTAPTIQSSTFQNIKTNGTLHVPPRSDYSSWMSTDNYYLGKYNWTKVEDA